MSETLISREQADEDLLSASAFLGERINTADGRAEAMDAVVPRFLERGEVDLAAELANTVNDPFSRDRLLTRVAEKCAQVGDDEYSLQLVDALEDDGLRAEALERIGLVKAGLGEIDAAREIASSMQHPDFVEAAIAAAIAETDETAGVAAIEKIEFSSARVEAFHQIARKLIAAEKMENAASMIDRSLPSARETEHVEEKLRAMCDAGNLFVAAKRNDRAVETFSEAKATAEGVENVHRDFFLGSCALGFLSAGSDELAERTLELLSDKTHIASTLVGFARIKWNRDAQEDAASDLDDAYDVLRSQRDIETRDWRARAAIWTSVATQLAGFGSADRGLAVAAENVDEAQVTSAIIEIGQILVMQKEDERARSTVRLLAEASDRVASRLVLAKAFLEREDEANARAELAAAEEENLTVPQLSARANGSTEIAAFYKQLGSDADAARNVAVGIDAILQIKDESRQAASLAEITAFFTKIAELPEATREQVHTLLDRVEYGS